MDCISLSHCMLLSVVGYRPCTYTKCEKLIHSSLSPLFEFCPKLTIKMTQHTTTCFVLGCFTFPYNAKIKIILQLQDTSARVCSIYPRYITIPKHAWQDTLDAHVHNSMYKLIVHSAQRTQYMQYSTGNTYLIAEVMYFPLHLCHTGAQCLPHRLPAHASFFSVFVLYVPAVPNLRVRLV